MYYRLLPEIKNAVMARKDRVTFPFSKMDHAVLMALVSGGYIKSVEKEVLGKKSVLVVKLMKKGTVNDFKLMSKPSRHSYIDYRSLRSVKQGHGIGVLSTSRGIMTTKDARKQKVGGEYLFEIW
jgi:small subunit ribosomal protein S8